MQQNFLTFKSCLPVSEVTPAAWKIFSKSYWRRFKLWLISAKACVSTQEHTVQPLLPVQLPAGRPALTSMVMLSTWSSSTSAQTGTPCSPQPSPRVGHRFCFLSWRKTGLTLQCCVAPCLIKFIKDLQGIFCTAGQPMPFTAHLQSFKYSRGWVCCLIEFPLWMNQLFSHLLQQRCRLSVKLG